MSLIEFKETDLEKVARIMAPRIIDKVEDIELLLEDTTMDQLVLKVLKDLSEPVALQYASVFYETELDSLLMVGELIEQSYQEYLDTLDKISEIIIEKGWGHFNPFYQSPYGILEEGFFPGGLDDTMEHLWVLY